MGRRPIVWLIPACLLISTAAFLVLRWSNSLEVEFADGRIIRVEAVTYGTSHVVGRSASWVGPLRKVLPSRLATVLISSREQSRFETEIPSLVVWLHAFDPEKQIYLDSQGLQITLVDEHRDVYPSNSSAHFSFGSGFNRQAHVFAVFPRRPSKLNLHLKPWRADGDYSVSFRNPGKATRFADWTPEDLPSIRREGELEFTLESLVIRTNGLGDRFWESESRHWEPAVKLTQAGEPALQWESPEWVAEDVTGNRGWTLGFHEPLLKFVATTRPLPAAVTAESDRWHLSNTSPGIPLNLNRSLRGASITVIGIFGAGLHTFHQGRLTNSPAGFVTGGGWGGLSKQVAPGVWEKWHMHMATQMTAYVRCEIARPGQRIAVALRDQEGNLFWGETPAGEQDGIWPFVFNLAPQEGPVSLEVVLLEPVQAEFVVKPPLP